MWHAIERKDRTYICWGRTLSEAIEKPENLMIECRKPEEAFVIVDMMNLLKAGPNADNCNPLQPWQKSKKKSDTIQVETQSDSK